MSTAGSPDPFQALGESRSYPGFGSTEPSILRRLPLDLIGERRWSSALVARRSKAAGRSTPDRPRAERALSELLEALAVGNGDENLDGTPARAAAAWLDVLTAGHHADPAAALGRLFPSDQDGTLVVKDIPFISSCPHHLLPMKGYAHVALLPNGKVPGFGNVAKLVDVFAHRLILQESLTQRIASELRRLTGAKAAACVIEAEHLCVAVTDPPRQNARFRTAAGAGPKAEIERLYRELEATAHPNR